MGILSIIGAFLKLVVMFMKGIIERDKEKKAKIKEARSELQEGIKNRDASAVLRAFNKRNSRL